jgi:hypothetical protein
VPVSREWSDRLVEPDVWKPFLIVLITFTLQILVGIAAIGQPDTTHCSLQQSSLEVATSVHFFSRQ